jgi:molybdopterin synthase sulfur carrier subunit
VTAPSKIRIMLPAHLRTLARVNAEVIVEVTAPATLSSALDALEAGYPVLCGTIRDHDTLRRRAFIRYFACQEDLSHQGPDTPLPEDVLTGREPLIVLGAIAGG